MSGKSRAGRKCRVQLVSVGPEWSFEPEELYRGERDKAIEFYQNIRESGEFQKPGAGVVVVDGFDRVIYACS